MQIAYQLNSDELNADLIASIKSLFKNKEIEIIVHDEEQEERLFTSILESAYTQSQSVDREEFLRAIHEN